MRTPLVRLRVTEVAADDTGVFVLTRGGVPEGFDGRVLRVAHGGSLWDVLATGRKLPSQLKPIPGGMAWTYEIPLGYVVEAFVNGGLVTLFERREARLTQLTVDGDRLVFAEQRLKRLPIGAILVTSEARVLSVQLP
jgi:hypothetical protein